MKKKEQIKAFLGENTAFEGRLSFKGTVRIDGRFKGQIHTEGTLVVGESAVLQSDVKAALIIVSGEIQGNITASERVEIRAPGKVFGNIETPVLVIDEGVLFEGRCLMKKSLKSEDQRLAVVA